MNKTRTIDGTVEGKPPLPVIGHVFEAPGHKYVIKSTRFQNSVLISPVLDYYASIGGQIPRLVPDEIAEQVRTFFEGTGIRAVLSEESLYRT